MRKFTIMMVDDEPHILKAISRAVRKSPHEFVWAHSASETLEVMEERYVDILVTDQRMPAMSGIELCERIHGTRPAVLRYILSGYAESEELERALDLGHVQQFLRKPEDMGRLPVLLEGAVAQCAAARAFEEIGEECERAGDSCGFGMDFRRGLVSLRLDAVCAKADECITGVLTSLPLAGFSEERAREIVLAITNQRGHLGLSVEATGNVEITAELPVREERLGK